MANLALLKHLQRCFIGYDTEYPTLDGKLSPRIYLDSAASTLMLQPAHEVGEEFLKHYASTHSDMHYSARGANHAYAWAHEKVLQFVGASADNYAAFFAGSGATAGFNRMANSLARLRPERNVVLISGMEHHSNDLPHRQHSGTAIHIPSLGENERCGGLDLAALQQLIETHGHNINYVTVTAASNVTGAITPLAEVAALAHSVGAYLLVDAAQMAAHAPLSMDDIGVDVLVFSGHKIYAPGSPGAVVARKQLLEIIEPTELGGGMVDDVTLTDYQPVTSLSEREEAGTPNIVGAIVLGAVLDLLIQVGMDQVREKEITQVNYLWDQLATMEDVILYGPEPAATPRTGTMTFNIRGFDHGLTAAALNDYHNIQVRNGCFCAHLYTRELRRREMWEIDIDPEAPDALTIIERKRGMARASFGLHTTRDDLDALVAAMAALIENREAILEVYRPVGKNGYQHKSFKPPAEALFDPLRAIARAPSLRALRSTES